MKAYWDASALLALIFNESHSAHAALARAQTREMFAWSWARVEISAGSARRRADDHQRALLDQIVARMHWHELKSSDYPDLARANDTWRLRAADSGHLFAFRRLAQAEPGLSLVCFDTELRAAARAAKLRVWSPR